MRALLLSLVLSLGLSASTTYKSPAFIVETSELYCTDYNGSSFIIKPVGDIVTGEYAANYCGFTKEIAETKRKHYAEQKAKRDNDPVGTFILWTFAILLFIACFMLMASLIKQDD